MGGRWKSFWMGTFAAIAIAVFAGLVMSNNHMSVGEKFSTPSTRL